MTVENGLVTLFGLVDSFAQKQIARGAASSVKGVKAVAEDLKVKLAGNITYDDDDIAIAALEYLSLNTSIPKDAVKVSTEDGWVTLTVRSAGSVKRKQ